jgi:hypothetical protein
MRYTASGSMSAQRSRCCCAARPDAERHGQPGNRVRAQQRGVGESLFELDEGRPQGGRRVRTLRRLYGFRPGSRATTARTSLRGKRCPLSAQEKAPICRASSAAGTSSPNRSPTLKRRSGAMCARRYKPSRWHKEKARRGPGSSAPVVAPPIRSSLARQPLSRWPSGRASLGLPPQTRTLATPTG